MAETHRQSTTTSIPQDTQAPQGTLTPQDTQNATSDQRHQVGQPHGHGSGDTVVRRQRFFTPAVVTLVALSFMLGLSEFIMVGILPQIARGLNISEVTVGNLVSLFAVAYAPATPIGSALSARFPRFATHMMLVAVFLVGNILCMVAPNYPILLIARIMIALVAGTTVAVSMTYAPDVSSAANRTRFIAWVFSGFSIASVAGVPVGTWVAGTFGWRAAFALIVVLTVALMLAMVLVLPRNSHPMTIGFLPQFRLFADRRIRLGVFAVLFGAAASYVFYTYLTPILRDEIGIPQRFVSIGLMVFGAACLCSNLYSGRLANRGTGVAPLARIRPIYLMQAVLLCLLAFAKLLPVTGALLLIVLGLFMYLQNSASQVLYMDVAARAHPGSMNLAASLNSMSFNIGIALGSAVGGVVNDEFGLTWLGPFGAVFALLAALTVSGLHPTRAELGA